MTQSKANKISKKKNRMTNINILVPIETKATYKASCAEMGKEKKKTITMTDDLLNHIYMVNKKHISKRSEY